MLKHNLNFTLGEKKMNKCILYISLAFIAFVAPSEAVAAEISEEEILKYAVNPYDKNHIEKQSIILGSLK